MNFTDNKCLYKRLNAKGFKPLHVAEVGVYHPETSNIYDYIEQGIKTTLVEPSPDSIKRINDYFDDYSNITLHEVAAYDYNGELSLSQRGASTYATELKSSPAIVNDNYIPSDDDSFSVKSVTFDTIDDGTIDLLSVDVEGSEWFTLKYMTSRPTVISVETHGQSYLNPYIKEIKRWMKENGYCNYYKDGTDTVFVKKGTLDVTLSDCAKLLLMELYMFLRKFR